MAINVTVYVAVTLALLYFLPNLPAGNCQQSNHSGELQSEFSWHRLTHPF